MAKAKKEETEVPPLQVALMEISAIECAMDLLAKRVCSIKAALGNLASVQGPAPTGGTLHVAPMDPARVLKLSQRRARVNSRAAK